MPSATGPLGELPGMRWDAAKQKYFPAAPAPVRAPSAVDIARLRGLIPRGSSSTSAGSASISRLAAGASGSASRNVAGSAGNSGPGAQGPYKPSTAKWTRPVRAGVDLGQGKRRKVEEDKEVKVPRRSGLPKMLKKVDASDSILQAQFENMTMTRQHHNCGCCNDYITSIQAFRNDSYMATTAHGMVIQHESGDMAGRFEGCSAGVAALHVDLPRMTSIIISEGPEPHIHVVKRHSDAPDAIITDSDDVPGTRTKDVWAVSGFDGRVSVASTRAIHTLTYESDLKWSTRRMPSDPLAVSHVDRDLLYAGLRNGTAHLVDLRSPPSAHNQIVRSLGGKAIVNVKKVDDGAVPFGLAISAMNHEMLIFDARFPSVPLHVLDGHHNSAYTDLGWAFSSGDRFLFAASTQLLPGRDFPEHTINAWHTSTGERLIPVAADFAGQSHLLDRKFPGRIRAIAVREGDRGLDVGSGPAMFRYGPLVENEAEADLEQDDGGAGRYGHSHGPGSDEDEDENDYDDDY